MQSKEYRVVCSRPKFSDKLIVDIAPAQGVIHDQIFFSRWWLHKKQTGEDLVKYNYSFMIKEVADQEPEILYPEAFNESKKSEAYRVMLRDFRELTPEILRTFKNMRAQGLESTLYVYSAAEQAALEETVKTPEEEAFDRKQREKRARLNATTDTVSYKQKHAEDINTKPKPVYAQNRQQEDNMYMVENFREVQQRRVVVEKKRATQLLSAWQRHQLKYSGD